jgi:hypothetical protein
VKTYRWQIAPDPTGKVILSTHDITVGSFDTQEAAEQYVAYIVKRDVIERRSRRWSERALRKWVDRWAAEFDLPRAEVLADTAAGMAAMLVDLAPTISEPGDPTSPGCFLERRKPFGHFSNPST